VQASVGVEGFESAWAGVVDAEVEARPDFVGVGEPLGHFPHLAVRVVDVLERALDRHERIFRELDDFTRAPVLQQPVERTGFTTTRFSRGSSR
jgi:hypothetical protein